MSLPETPNNGPDTLTPAELRSALESLRGAFQVVALAGIVLSCAILAFFYKEVRVLGRQNNEMLTVIQDYNTNVAARIDLWRTNFEVFSKTNPNFVPIYKKYFATNAAPVAPAKP